MKTTTLSNRGKTDELHDILMDGIARLVTTEDWKAMLTTSARFTTYSPRNIQLIFSQRSDATRVASYGLWQKLNRQVRKGERAIRISAPCRYKVEADAEHGEKSSFRVSGFRPVSVFDISQTDGEPLPDVKPTLLEGSAPQGAWDAITAIIRKEGFTVERRHCDDANGFTDYRNRMVVVADHLTPAASFKTLVHELTHALAHEDALATGTRPVVEVEAESTAFIVCHALGLASDDYSFPYIALWGEGDLELIRSTTLRVAGLAKSILDRSGLLEVS